MFTNYLVSPLPLPPNQNGKNLKIYPVWAPDAVSSQYSFNQK